MKLTCDNCRTELLKRLSDVPSSWRDEIVNSICTVLDDAKDINCTDVKECETVTELSDFEIDGTQVCISYTAENGVTVKRCFNFSEIINSSLDDVNPSCITSAAEWTDWSYLEKWQAIIDKVCTTCAEPPQTTTSTTTRALTTTTTLAPGSTTSSTTGVVTTQPPQTTIATTTTSSTTTTTTLCPAIVGVETNAIIIVPTTTTTTTEQGEILIQGTINGTLSDVQNVANPGNLRLTFAQPLPVSLYFEWGFDITPTPNTDRTYLPQSFSYPEPRTYTIYSSTGGSAAGVGTVVPAGATSFVRETANKSLLSAHYAQMTKIVFYNAIIPAGYKLVLTPTRSDLSFELR